MADASGAHSVFEWLQIISLGGMMGAIGQGARTVVGMKKVNDAAASSAVSASDLFTASRIFVSFAIGFIAGGVAAITIVKSIISVSPEQLFTLSAAGYAGADFIEGAISRVSGSASAPKGQESVGVGTGGATSAGADIQDGSMG